MMLDIASGLEYLHTRKPSIIHRDCKSSNILITAKGTAKIADFGLAKVKQSTRSMVRSLVGTVNWQAPELWHACAPEVQSQGGCLLMRDGVLGDAPMACTYEEVPMGGM